MHTPSPISDQLPCRWYPPCEDDADIGWAHVSGWAQLNGTRRSLSCIVPVHNELPRLRQLLPALSDTLTECGFPWEIIVVDRASRDGTEAAMRTWCELPGYRLLALDGSIDAATATALGFTAARGDGIVLLDATGEHRLWALSEMVMRWDAGGTVVLMTEDHRTGEFIVQARQPVSTAPGWAQDDATEAELVLLDRSVVLDLLR
jgi:glycosyltransferase involved in cell wall biosynthesis